MWSDQTVYLGWSGVSGGKSARVGRGQSRARDDFECTAEGGSDVNCFSDPAQGI